MNKILLVLMMMLSGMAGAQIVNIPDAAFKAKLLSASTSNDVAKNSSGSPMVIDVNGDNQIQVTEALAVWQLVVTDTQIISMSGIEAFTNLRKLRGSPQGVVSLNVTALTNLIELDLFNHSMASITLGNLSNLKSLRLTCNALTSLDCSGLTSLEELQLSSNALGSLMIANLPSLKIIDLNSSSLLTSLDCTGLTGLEKFDCNCDVESLDCTGLTSLEELTLFNYTITSLNCTGMISLKSLDLDCYSMTSLIMGNHPDITDISLIVEGLPSLDLTGLTSLENLLMSSPESMTSLVLGNLPNLNWFSLGSRLIQDLDLSGCTALAMLTLNYGDFGDMNSAPHFLNLKNGITQYENLQINLYADSDSQLYVCIDEGNETLIPASALSNPNIQVGTYCTFTPGGNYNSIAGNVTFDSDNNGCGGSDGFSGLVRMGINDGTGSFIAYTGSGYYSFYTQAGTFTLSPQFENPTWFTATPPSATVTLATVNNSTTTQNFCIAANGVHPDVEVVVTPLGTAQPGFDADYKIVYKNKGNQTLSGAVMLNYDNAVLDYVSAFPVENSSAAGSLTWNYSSLLPFESRAMVITLNLNGPMETPAVNIDDVLAFSASVTPTTGDETPADNTFTLNQVVVGSFDPNDITCLEGDSVNSDRIGEYLHYNINFENTGTAPATFIVVKDMIDETKFDISTLQLMNASHAVETRVNGNKVEFIFDNINLAALGKGNVVFKIKTLATLQVNDDVMQQADIFFDYNWPIQTNEAVTTFEVLSRGDFEMDSSVTVYPNPAKGIMTISADSNVRSIQLYDIQGRLLQSGTVNGTDTTIDLSSRGSGMYFIKVYTEKGMRVEKVVKE